MHLWATKIAAGFRAILYTTSWARLPRFTWRCSHSNPVAHDNLWPLCNSEKGGTIANYNTCSLVQRQMTGTWQASRYSRYTQQAIEFHLRYMWDSDAHTNYIDSVRIRAKNIILQRQITGKWQASRYVRYTKQSIEFHHLYTYWPWLGCMRCIVNVPQSRTNLFASDPSHFLVTSQLASPIL